MVAPDASTGVQLREGGDCGPARELSCLVLAQSDTTLAGHCLYICIDQEIDELTCLPFSLPQHRVSPPAQGMWLIPSERPSLIRRESCPGDHPQGLLCKDVPELRGPQTCLNSNSELIGAKSHLHHYEKW